MKLYKIEYERRGVNGTETGTVRNAGRGESPRERAGTRAWPLACR